MQEFFFLKDTATTEIYTLSLPDALPIGRREPAPARPRGRPLPARREPVLARGRRLRADGARPPRARAPRAARPPRALPGLPARDRKSTRLNSSHANISYAVFCLIKKIHL